MTNFSGLFCMALLWHVPWWWIPTFTTHTQHLYSPSSYSASILLLLFRILETHREYSFPNNSHHHLFLYIPTIANTQMVSMNFKLLTNWKLVHKFICYYYSKKYVFFSGCEPTEFLLSDFSTLLPSFRRSFNQVNDFDRMNNHFSPLKILIKFLYSNGRWCQYFFWSSFENLHHFIYKHYICTYSIARSLSMV